MSTQVLALALSPFGLTFSMEEVALLVVDGLVMTLIFLRYWMKYGDRLVRVRYRGNRKRRARSTTVEIIVEEAYWDPEGYQAWKLAMFNNGHSI